MEQASKEQSSVRAGGKRAAEGKCKSASDNEPSKTVQLAQHSGRLFLIGLHHLEVVSTRDSSRARRSADARLVAPFALFRRMGKSKPLRLPGTDAPAGTSDSEAGTDAPASDVFRLAATPESKLQQSPNW